MSDRYSKIFRLPENLYTKGCPIIISAGALLWDAQLRRFVAQLKLLNVGKTPVRAATVELLARSAAGEPSSEPVVFTYQNVFARRGASFGENTAITLPDREGRIFDPLKAPASFSVKITEVVFSDESLWQGRLEPTPLPEPESLEHALSDRELVLQYRIRFGAASRWFPWKNDELWQCSCGSYNQLEETTCCRCGQSRDGQLFLDLSALAQQRDERLAAERQHEQDLIRAEEIVVRETKAKAAVIWKNVTTAAICVLLLVGAVFAANSFLIPSIRYHRAEALMEKDSYEQAAQVFLSLEDFRDSKDRAAEAAEKGEKYAEAMQLLDEERFDEAYAILEEIGSTKTFEEIKLERAEAALNEGRVRKALDLLSGLEESEAVAALRERIDNMELPAFDVTVYADAQAGDVIEFGEYQQDNGVEPIRWLVLERKDDRLLLLSERILDTQKYDNSRQPVTWENCSLRAWLNADFFETAFSEMERTIICETPVSAGTNPSYPDADPGSEVTDRVFLLSAEEAMNYFRLQPELKRTATAYAQENGCQVSDDSTAAWWLRSPGKNNSSAAAVLRTGMIDLVGMMTYVDVVGVCPAVWIDIAG